VGADRREEIAELLKRRLEELRERDAARGSGPFGSRRPSPSHVPVPVPVPVPAPFPVRVAAHSPEPDLADLRRRLLERAGGRPLRDLLGGDEVPGCPGLFEVRDGAPAPIAPRPDVLSSLAASLWLVPGIRAGLAAKLCAAGFRDVRRLCDHPRFGPQARRVCRAIDLGDPYRLMDLLATRGARSHPLALALHALLDPSDLLFLDIETMGLFGGSPIVVAGLARVSGDRVELTQLVAASPAAEPALVRRTADAIAASPGLVTFNGRSFDLPYVGLRAAYYGAPLVADPVHFDLLPHSRRAYRGRVPDCRLDTLARHVLGEDRGEDVPGALVPLLYQDYLAAPGRRAGLLAAIADHNRADVVQMVRLFGALAGAA